MDISPLKTLPFEVRQRIFKNVHRLFASALVDRQLCRELMPLLWKEVLQYDGPQNIEVVNTFIKCLPYDKRAILRKEGIDKAPVSTNPTFNYPSFMQALITSFLWTGVSDWLFSNRSSSS